MDIWTISGGLFALIIAPLIVFWIQERWKRRKSAGEASKIETGNITAGGDVNLAGGNIININIVSPEDFQKRLKEQGVSLSKEQKEKINTCFIPGVKELETGRKLLQYGEEAKAKYHLEEAIKFFICAADALPCYETFFNLASAYNDYCDYENAKKNCQKAIQHDPSQPGAYNGLGIVYGKTSDYPKAEGYFQQTLVKAEKLTDKWGKLGWQATALTNLGNVYQETGQLEQALERYQQALRIDRKIGNKLGEANALTNLGNVYADTGQLEQALKQQQQALEIHREIGNKSGQAQALTNLGYVYYRTGQLEQALKQYQQALDIHREVGDKLGEADTLTGLGIVYCQTGQMEQAREHYQQALRIHREIGNKLGEAQDLNNLGSVYLETNQVERAREYYLSARAIFQGIGARHLVKQVDENLAKLPGG